MRAYEAEGPHNSPGFLLWHVSRRWQSLLAARLGEVDLTPAQFLVLGSLGWLHDVEKHTPTQRELAEHAGTDPMMTSQILRTLEERGLVTRKPDEEDARAVRVAPTSAGTKLVLSAVERVRAIDREVFDAKVPRRELVGLLRTLAEATGAPRAVTHPNPKKRSARV
jgi:MarR family transcriptional regulator, organic hydroperoxide resistance regulator